MSFTILVMTETLYHLGIPRMQNVKTLPRGRNLRDGRLVRLDRGKRRTRRCPSILLQGRIAKIRVCASSLLLRSQNIDDFSITVVVPLRVDAH
jgi:hypothetical protein